MTLADKLSRANKAFQNISTQYQETLKENEALKVTIESLRASMLVISEDHQNLTDALAIKKRELAAATRPARKPRKAKESNDNIS